MMNGAEEMALWLKVLAAANEDLSSAPGTRITSQARSHSMLMSPVTLYCEEQTGGSLGFSGCQDTQKPGASGSRGLPQRSRA